jgi:hypothetical protein
MPMTASVPRSPVGRAMLNPALLTVIATAAAEEYHRAAKEPMPWALMFLVPPMVLHRDTREALPRTTATHWSTWVGRNPVLLSGYPLRARSLVEPTRAGLRFGLVQGVLAIDDDQRLRGHLRAKARPADVGDVAVVLRSSGFVGKWLTKLDSPATAFALLGVAP